MPAPPIAEPAAIEVRPDAGVWEVHRAGAVVYWHPSRQRALDHALLLVEHDRSACVVVYDFDGSVVATYARP